MVSLLKNIAVSTRPTQWLKNLSLYAALVFSGNLLDKEKFLLVTLAVITFSILTSGVYLFNDLIDAPRDRLHPFKRFRPIASGDLPLPFALLVAVTCFFIALYLAINLSFFFFILCLFYLFLQIAYSLVLKNTVIVDVLVISTGFIVRVLAGALVINVHLSVWFLLCVISASLFLSVGKRRAETTILSDQSSGHRRTLDLYPTVLLDNYLSLFGASAWMSWALFTFFEPPLPIQPAFFLPALPLTFAGISKWLMVTIPIVVYGIMRYLKIIYEGGEAESPDKVLLSDKPLLVTFIIWVILIIMIIYGGKL